MPMRCLRILLALTLLATPGIASDMPAPGGAVVLTVTGEIGVSNRADAAEFDMPMLQDLAAHSFETTTIWTDGPQQFTGVQLSDLMQALGVSGGTIRATAINDYSVEIPMDDAIDGGALIAYRRNGEPMSVRANGPLWIVYPYDTNPTYQSEVVYARSIWQLNRLEVVSP